MLHFINNASLDTLLTGLLLCAQFLYFLLTSVAGSVVLHATETLPAATSDCEELHSFIFASVIFGFVFLLGWPLFFFENFPCRCCITHLNWIFGLSYGMFREREREEGEHLLPRLMFSSFIFFGQEFFTSDISRCR